MKKTVLILLLFSGIISAQETEEITVEIFIGTENVADTIGPITFTMTTMDAAWFVKRPTIYYSYYISNAFDVTFQTVINHITSICDWETDWDITTSVSNDFPIFG